MAQVKLIETEQPEQFKPVTIQITFETQEELNAMDAVTGWNNASFDAVKDKEKVYNTSIKDWRKVSFAIYNKIKPFAK